MAINKFDLDCLAKKKSCRSWTLAVFRIVGFQEQVCVCSCSVFVQYSPKNFSELKTLIKQECYFFAHAIFKITNSVVCSQKMLHCLIGPMDPKVYHFCPLNEPSKNTDVVAAGRSQYFGLSAFKNKFVFVAFQFLYDAVPKNSVISNVQTN